MRLLALRAATDAARRVFLPVDRAARRRHPRAPWRGPGRPDAYDAEREWERLRAAWQAAIAREQGAWLNEEGEFDA